MKYSTSENNSKSNEKLHTRQSKPVGSPFQNRKASGKKMYPDAPLSFRGVCRHRVTGRGTILGNKHWAAGRGTILGHWMQVIHRFRTQI